MSIIIVSLIISANSMIVAHSLMLWSHFQDMCMLHTQIALSYSLARQSYWINYIYSSILAHIHPQEDNDILIFLARKELDFIASLKAALQLDRNHKLPSLTSNLDV